MADHNPTPAPRSGETRMKLPWRNECPFNTQEREELKEFILSYEPLTLTGVETANVLVVGQIGAGKSSFFNTINSIYRGHITVQAPTGQDTESLTKQFRIYEIRASRNRQSMHFHLCDTMGLEEGSSRGMDITDFHYFLDGLIPDRFQFQSKKRFSESITTGPSTSLAGQIHTIAIAIDANSLDFLDESMVDQLRKIRAYANGRALPVAILLTKIDTICPMVGQDIAKVFSSPTVGQAVTKAADLLHMSPSHVLPVKNYNSETILDDRVDILALSAMKHLLTMADSYFDEQLSLNGITLSDSQYLDEDCPWRKGLQFSSESLANLRSEVETYQPPGSIPFARILLLGPTGAGKSSFFNTINSIYRKSVTAQAAVGYQKQSTTTKHREYRVTAGRTGPLMNFHMCDTMGLDEVKMDLPTVRCLLKGFIADGYEFKARRVEEVDTKRKMTLAEGVHAVAIAVDAVQANSLAAGIRQKLSDIAEECRIMGLQPVVILTKIDSICDKVRRDITKVYHSNKVYECVTTLADTLSIPAAYIFPVKNYETELALQEGMDILALSALKHLLDGADNYIDDHLPVYASTRTVAPEETHGSMFGAQAPDDHNSTVLSHPAGAVPVMPGEQPVSHPPPVQLGPSAQLPSGWYTAYEEDRLYYYNFITRETSWEIPTI